jgi:hypothetical protein
MPGVWAPTRGAHVFAVQAKAPAVVARPLVNIKRIQSCRKRRRVVLPAGFGYGVMQPKTEEGQRLKSLLQAVLGW